MLTRRFAGRLGVPVILGLASLSWAACSDRTAPPTGPTLAQAGLSQDSAVRQAMRIQERHTPRLLRAPGVVGTAVGLNAAGRPVVQVFVAAPGITGVPDELDGIPVQRKVTGLFMAGTDPTTRKRPAELGFSVGHPAITAGTIGARVRDGSGKVYVLSNNHVLANANNAQIGDPIYQPGPFDGGTAADQVATLSDFEPIDFSLNGSNLIDAGIAESSEADLDFRTPADDGYGAPNTTIFGDGNNDGAFDNLGALLGLGVQKYGRTTELTAGEITGINATVEICYEVVWIICITSAIFDDQLIIEPGSFSDGGDSGSLIVTNDGDKYPVALLFAGSTTQTIANRIDHVLARFNVVIDGESATPPPPPTPVTDVAVTAVVAPASVTQGTTADVDVTVRNVGNQAVSTAFDVTLYDVTGIGALGTQAVAGLAAGASTTLTFPWNTTGAAFGSHTLTAVHDLGARIAEEADPTNDSLSAMSTVTDPATLAFIHVGDLDAITSSNRNTWSATVEIAVHDANHSPINGVTVRGSWNPAGLASDECTTGDLGGNGTCIVLYPSIPKKQGTVTFTVTSITLAGKTYDVASNHDPDGDSDGTVIAVRK